MPEGPEIRLAADKIARVLVGKKLESVTLTLPLMQDYEDVLRGRTVTAIDTRGKAMLTRFDNGLVMYSHNQLYGRWYTSKLPRLPKTTRSLRVAFDTDTHTARLYSATDIDILEEDRLDEHPFLKAVGPDVLDPALKPADIVKRLESKRFSGRAFGSLYLDQHFLAGIGNYLRSEILWAGRVFPTNRPKDVDRATLQRLARETLKLCRRSYQTKGITVTSKIAQREKAKGLRYGQYRHYVFSRGGEACHECSTRIERTNVGSRKLFYCPVCQPA
ncbi:MAG: endonuclease VIII [Woeseiaceae bacterium]|nr:endonuclease VIII [Woeseiaceae bacterium]